MEGVIGLSLYFHYLYVCLNLCEGLRGRRQKTEKKFSLKNSDSDADLDEILTTAIKPGTMSSCFRGKTSTITYHITLFKVIN